MFGASLILTPAQQESGGVKIVGVMRAANTRTALYAFSRPGDQRRKHRRGRARALNRSGGISCLRARRAAANKSQLEPAPSVCLRIWRELYPIRLFRQPCPSCDVCRGPDQRHRRGPRWRERSRGAISGGERNFRGPFRHHAHRTHGPRRAGLSLPVFIGSARRWHWRRGRAGLMGLERRAAGACKWPCCRCSPLASDSARFRA